MSTASPTLLKPTVRIIHLEDNSYDQELVAEMLSSSGIECEIIHADDQKTFQTALEGIKSDLIISDFTMPGYTGVRALEFAQQAYRSVPFIFFSGTIGEDAAIESLKRGATDYVLKQFPDRLVAAVRRALTEAGERAARHHAEEELMRRDVLLRQIMENVEDLIAVVDFNGCRMLSSPSYQKLFGQDHSAVGSDFLTEVHPADKKQVQNNFAHTIAAGVGRRVEYRIILSDGNVRFMEAQGSVIRHNENDSYVLWVAHDITEHKFSEAKILEQAALLDKAQDAIFVCNLQEKITYWNQGATRLYGWTPQEVADKSIQELLFKDMPSDWEEIRNAVSVKGEWFGDLHQVTRDGRTVVVQSRQTLISNSSNEPSSVLYINSDITEKKQIEAQFLRTQRMENLGALAGGIAHDLNNVLAPIMLAVEIIQDDPWGDSNVKLLETIASSTRRGSDLVKQILSFARGATGQKVPLQVRHVVSEVVKLVRNTFPRNIVVNSNVPHNLPNIVGDSTQLHQVLLNLCVNARDAMHNDGSLTIKASTVKLEGKKLPLQPGPVTGSFVVLSVADTGTGIPPDMLAKIFEPFFTTKDAGKGTGLGLSTVMSIVKNHGGFIEISSHPGAGTTFHVYFPVPRESAILQKAAEETKPKYGNGEQILVVDDEIAINEIICTTLNAYNYRVLTAGGGTEAIQLFSREYAGIDLVITDMVMPAVDGSALVQALRKIKPGIKIVAMSGYVNQSKIASLSEGKIQSFLLKPFTTTQLLSTLSSILGSPASPSPVPPPSLS